MSTDDGRARLARARRRVGARRRAGARDQPGARRRTGTGAAAVAAALLTCALVSGCSVLSAGATGPTASSVAPVEAATPQTPSGPPSQPPSQPSSQPPSQPEPQTTPEPDPTPPSDTAAPTDAAPLTPEGLAPIGRGDEGPAVVALQERLIDLGYLVGSADGVFGARTQQAVWAVQKVAGLTRDGLVGPATQAAVESGVHPTPRTTSGRTIEIDLDRQLLLAVDDGVVTRVINASSGNGESYEARGTQQRAFTPNGDFTVTREIDGLRESSLGLGTMYRPKYFHGGWAVHGSGSVPPWPASHGCVRVSNAAMSWIWDVWGAPVGTPVLIY